PASIATPTRAGTYTVTASATGFDSLTSDPVTVTRPFLKFAFSCGAVGARLHRNFTINFSDPVPDGGLTLNLASSDPTIVTVPASLDVVAGLTTASFPVAGLVPGVVEITVSAPGWIGDSKVISAVTPTFYFYPYG